MTNRYVILNCPTLMGNRLCYSKTIKQCADCTDCLLKRIVEKCKERTVGFIEEGAIKEEFLQLFEIEECE